MIAINGVNLNELIEKSKAPAKKNPFVQNWEAAKEFIDGLTFPVELKFTSDKIHSPVSTDQRLEYSAGFFVPYSEQMILEEGQSAEVIFYETKGKDKNGKDVFEPAGFPFNKPVHRFKSKMFSELIYFLIFVSPHCEILHNDFAKYQNKIRRRSHFLFQDNDWAAKIQSQISKYRQMVINVIYDPSIGLKEKEIRALARTYMIMGTENLPLDQVRNYLEQRILNKQYELTPNNYEKFVKKFIADSGAGDLITIKSSVSDLRSRNIVKVIDEQGSYSWGYTKKGGDEILCKITDIANVDYSLIKYFQANPEKLVEIENLSKT